MTSVVIVDDVPEVRALVRTSLRLGGRYNVVGEAATATEAIKRAADLQPDLVVLDLGLPDLSGQEVLTRLRDVAPRAKVVIFTGAADPDSEQLASQAAGYVHKDHPEQLIAALERATQTVERFASNVTFAGELPSARRARAYVRTTLRAWGLEHLAENACAVVSELAANAVEHARSDFTLRLEGARDHPDRVRVEIADAGAGTPEPQAFSDTAEGGRGLLIVSALAEAWGIETRDGDAKAVWAELTSDQGR